MAGEDQKVWRRIGFILGPALSAVLIAAAAWYFWPAPAPEGPYAALKARGKLIVGVRTNAEPFSYLDSGGEILGFEPELARALAQELGVELSLVPVEASTVLGYVERRVVDVAFIPLPNMAEDTDAVHLVEPGYYSSGLTAVVRRGVDLTAWDGLSGMTACGILGERGSAPIVEEFGGRFIGFSDARTALQALAAERCDALVEDETEVAYALAEMGDAGFERPLDTIDAMPWRVMVASQEAELAQFVRETLIRWHNGGFLIERAAAWDLPESHYLIEARTYLADPAIN